MIEHVLAGNYEKIDDGGWIECWEITKMVGSTNPLAGKYEDQDLRVEKKKTVKRSGLDKRFELEQIEMSQSSFAKDQSFIQLEGSSFIQFPFISGGASLMRCRCPHFDVFPNKNRTQKTDMLGLGLANRIQDSTSVLRQSETDLKNVRVNSNSRTFQKLCKLLFCLRKPYQIIGSYRSIIGKYCFSCFN